MAIYTDSNYPVNTQPILTTTTTTAEPNIANLGAGNHTVTRECVKTQSMTEQLRGIVQDLVSTPVTQNQTKKEPLTPNQEYKTTIQPLHSFPSQNPDENPEWHAKVHRLLMKLSKINQEEPIDASDIQQVRTWAMEVMASENPDEMRMLLKLLSQYYFVGAKQIFFEVLNKLRKVTPEINQYFKDVPKEYFKDIDFDMASEGPVLSDLGIRQIFRMQEAEFGYAAGMLTTVGASDLSSSIDKIILSPSQDMIQGWIVENDLFPGDHHAVPVLALKVKGKTHVFIFDSLGHNLSADPNERQLSFVLEDLIQHFRKSKLIDNQPSLYSYKNKRQHTFALDCVTFSLLDLKNLIERHLRGADNLLTFYAKQDPKNQPRNITSILAKGSLLPIFEIDILPPELMKVTQSKKQIQAYVENSPALDISSVPVFQRFTPDGQVQQSPQTLSELTTKVTENERVGSNKKAMNLYVDRKRLAEIVYALALHFREKKLGQSSPSSSTSTSSNSSSQQKPPVKRLLKFKTPNNKQ